MSPQNRAESKVQKLFKQLTTHQKNELECDSSLLKYLGSRAWSDLNRTCSLKLEELLSSATFEETAVLQMEFLHRCMIESAYRLECDEQLEFLCNHYQKMQRHDLDHLTLWHSLEAISRCLLDEMEAAQLILDAYQNQPMNTTLLEAQFILWMRSGFDFNQKTLNLNYNLEEFSNPLSYFLGFSLTQLNYIYDLIEEKEIHRYWSKFKVDMCTKELIQIQNYLNGQGDKNIAHKSANKISQNFPDCDEFARWELLLEFTCKGKIKDQKRAQNLCQNDPMLADILQISESTAIETMPNAPKYWLTIISPLSIEKVARNSFEQQIALPLGKECRAGDIIFCAAFFTKGLSEDYPSKLIKVLSCYQAIEDASWDEEFEFLTKLEVRAVFDCPANLDVDLSKIQERRKKPRKGDPSSSGTYQLMPEALEFIKQGILSQNKSTNYQQLFTGRVSNG